ATAGRGDVHPLDLGRPRPAERVDVVAELPGGAGHRVAVEVTDEEGAERRVEVRRLDRGPVRAAVVHDVLLLHLHDQATSVRVGDRDPADEELHGVSLSSLDVVLGWPWVCPGGRSQY